MVCRNGCGSRDLTEQSIGQFLVLHKDPRTVVTVMICLFLIAVNSFAATYHACIRLGGPPTRVAGLRRLHILPSHGDRPVSAHYRRLWLGADAGAIHRHQQYTGPKLRAFRHHAKILPPQRVHVLGLEVLSIWIFWSPCNCLTQGYLASRKVAEVSRTRGAGSVQHLGELCKAPTGSPLFRDRAFGA